MKKVLISCILIAVYSLLANDDLKEYKFVREAKSDGKNAETLAIRFDNELYRHCNNDYSNILLLDDKGNKVPFAVRDLTEKGGGEYTGKITGFKRNVKNNTAEIELSFDKEIAFNSIKFDTDSRRFDKNIDIIFYAASGKIIRRDTNLKLYQYDKLYGSSAVKFELVNAKKLKIIIRNFLEKKALAVSTETVSNDNRTVEQNIRTEEFKIKKITLKNDMQGKRRLVKVKLSEISRANVNSTNTVIILDGAFVPLETLTVKADDKYYSRPAKLEFIGEDGKIKSLLAFNISDAQEKINLKGRRGKELFLNIVNGDNAPLKNITLYWEAPEKIILAESQNGKNLKVYYGGNASAKSYDIEKYADKLIFNNHSFYSLGQVQNAATYDPELPKEKIAKYLLWAILGAVILLLAFVIIKLMMSAPAADIER